MTTLERIAVGVDFSAASVAAVRWTAQHFVAAIDGAVLMLVHSVSAPDPPGFLRGRFPQVDALVANAETGARSRLRELAASLPLEGVPTVVRTGRPVDVLVQVATENRADLIVVGRHGQRETIWDRLGSTADALVRSSPVPVLLATGHRDATPQKIVVAVDDDELTNVVLRWATVLATAFGASVIAIHVMSNAVLSHVLSVEAVRTGKNTFTEEEMRARFGDEAGRWLERMVESGIEGMRASSHVVFGDPATEILAAAEGLGADLIILGRRSTSAVRRFLLGSVVREVLRSARCPVFVAVE